MIGLKKAPFSVLRSPFSVLRSPLHHCKLISLFIAIFLIFVACGGDNGGPGPGPGHTCTFGGWKVTTAATCTVEGVETELCSCGLTGSQTRPIAALGHVFGSASCPNTGCGIKYDYALGNTGPGGGIIFHVAPAGFTVEGYSGTTGSFTAYTAHYLEAAPSNSGSSNQWGSDVTLISGVTTFTSTANALASRIGNGRKDTRIIVAHLRDYTSETNRAAQVAASASFGSKGDWFLPSCGELNLLYQSGISGIITGWYWSSSQYSNGSAWRQGFGDGSQAFNIKSGTSNVRAVRAF